MSKQDKNHAANGGFGRRQFLGTAAAAGLATQRADEAVARMVLDAVAGGGS